MKLIIILANFLFALSNLNNGLVQSLPTPLAEVSDIKVFLYTRNNPTEPEALTLDFQSISSAKNFDQTRQNIFVIHGWQNSDSSDISVKVRSAYVQALNVNVFVIDWSSTASSSYETAFAAVPTYGKFVGDVILDMQQNLGLDSSQFLLVGYDLGAHLAGCAGAAANSNIDVIVGLDPAGRLYTNGNRNNRLDSSDAKHVQVIHTNEGVMGYEGNLGTVDMRPNGGSSQPGCDSDTDGTCSHERSYLYFAESLISAGFSAWKCRSQEDLTAGRCQANEQSHMGGVIIDTFLTGKFYLVTNAQSPFSKV